MASFVIHHIASEYFIKKLSQNYNFSFSEEDKMKFFLGNLIVDSSKIFPKINDSLSKEELKKLKEQLQTEKINTHFRDIEKLNLCIQAPNVDSFINKYQNLFNMDMSVLGYLFHLYTDKLFFEDLFNKTFICLDEFYKPTIYNSKIKYIKILKNDQIYSNDEFWFEGSSIYEDYTTMNKMLLEYYETYFDVEKLKFFGTHFFTNPGITEVDYQNISGVIDKTERYITDSIRNPKSTLNIFKENDIIAFINEVTDSFIAKYYDLIIESFKKRSR